MLGAVIALRRGEHMRLTAIVGGLSPAGRARDRALAIAAAVAFLLLMLAPPSDYAGDEWIIATPALGIHNT